jgi:hypothetical protein
LQLSKLGYREVAPGSSTFVHANGSVLVVYVDDFLLSTKTELMAGEWSRVASLIDLGAPEPLHRFLGCTYLRERRPAADDNKHTITKFTYDMEDYTISTVEAYLAVAPAGTTLKRVTTPFVTESDGPAGRPPATWEEMLSDVITAEKEPLIRGALAPHAAAVLMKALWAARVGRPDISVAVVRLARRITTWGVKEDQELHRLISYLHSTPTLKLEGEVHSDSTTWTIRCFADADFVSQGDTSCKSTSGMFVVLESGPPDDRRSFPLSWCAKKQSSVARSTPEAELAAASSAIFGSLIPLSIIFNETTGGEIPCVVEEDNSAAELIINKGYSAALRYLSRTHRVSIAAMSEALHAGHYQLRHCNSSDMRGDTLTKTFTAAQWPAALELILMRQTKSTSTAPAATGRSSSTSSSASQLPANKKKKPK